MMKLTISAAAWATVAVLHCAAGPIGSGLFPVMVAQAAEPSKPGQPAAAAPSEAPVMREFEPPPMPDFMLRKPAQPLSQAEMQRQADEAAEKARKAKAAAGQGAAPAGPETGSAPEGAGPRNVK